MPHPLAREILTLFRACSEPVYAVLQDLPLDQLNWKPAPDSRSIGEICRHLIRVDNWFLNHFGIEPVVDDPGAAGASVILQTMQKAHQHIETVLKQCRKPDDLLRSTAAEELQGHNTLAEAIVHMAQHYLYHLAQIVYLRRAQDRSWPAPLHQWEAATYVISDQLAAIQQLKQQSQ